MPPKRFGSPVKTLRVLKSSLVVRDRGVLGESPEGRIGAVHVTGGLFVSNPAIRGEGLSVCRVARPVSVHRRLNVIKGL